MGQQQAGAAPRRGHAIRLTSGSGQAAADAIEDESIQKLPLLGGGEAGIAHRAGRALRQPPAVARPVAREHARASARSPAPAPCGPAPARGRAGARYRARRRGSVPAGCSSSGAEIEAEDVDHLDGGLLGADGAQRLEVGLARLRGEDDELPDACPVFPGLDKFVHDTVQRATPESGASREGAGDGVHPVLDRRCPQDAERGREIVGEVLDDDRVAAERQVGSVLLGGANRYDERGPRASSRLRSRPGVISFMRQGRPG